ncbi:MAG: hypothetical protein PHY68_06765, partial [Proteiniphilum sp.]|nr:hypothetical protein [Proteiniphilum sp.]
QISGEGELLVERDHLLSKCLHHAILFQLMAARYCFGWRYARKHRGDTITGRGFKDHSLYSDFS